MTTTVIIVVIAWAIYTAVAIYWSHVFFYGGRRPHRALKWIALVSGVVLFVAVRFLP